MLSFRAASSKYIYHVGCAINFTFHHQFGIDTWRSTFEQQTDNILSACGSHGQTTRGSWKDRFESIASCTIHADSVEETSKHGVLGRYRICSKERIEVLSDTIERYHFLQGSEVGRQAEVNQPTQPNPNPNHDRTGRPVVTEQKSRSSAQVIETRFSRGCKNTDLFVARLEKDKEKDKNVDAHHDSTERPVVLIGQPTGSSTPFNEVDIDIWVSRLPHEVVKQAENSRFRELVKKIESHPHQQALQADPQQNNAYNPFSEKSKKMIKDMGNVALLSYARQFLKCNAKNAFFIGIKASSTALAGISWDRIKPAEVSSDGHWIFSQSRTMSLRKGDPMATVMGRLKNKRTTTSPII